MFAGAEVIVVRTEAVGAGGDGVNIEVVVEAGVAVVVVEETIWLADILAVVMSGVVVTAVEVESVPGGAVVSKVVFAAQQQRIQLHSGYTMKKDILLK